MSIRERKQRYFTLSDHGVLTYCTVHSPRFENQNCSSFYSKIFINALKIFSSLIEEILFSRCGQFIMHPTNVFARIFSHILSRHSSQATPLFQNLNPICFCSIAWTFLLLELFPSCIMTTFFLQYSSFATNIWHCIFTLGTCMSKTL